MYMRNQFYFIKKYMHLYKHYFKSEIIYCYQYNFFFFFTNIDCIFFSVIESHPDSVHEDLRLIRPFSRLVEYCNSLDMETMTQKASVIN